MQVLLFSRYSSLGASSRVRSQQYIPYLESQGINVTLAPLFGADYLRGLYRGSIRKISVLNAYVSRLGMMLRARRYALVWVEYEMLPWVPSWIELGLFPENIPLVVDYDDAIFHRYDQHRFSTVRQLLGKKIDAIMRRADLVIVGNEYIGERARQAKARRVELLPTVVDTTRYVVGSGTQGHTVTIGWIGSPSTVHYLYSVAPVFRKLIASHGIRIVAVGANPTQLRGLPIEVRPWSEDTEVSDIQHFDIGIMPLPDEPWERGKCGYKLIQYMACGKPVVASPVGVNSHIVRHGVEGFLATTEAEWNESIRMLCEDALLRKRMGAAGRVRVEAEYSLRTTAPRLEQLLRSLV